MIHVCVQYAYYAYISYIYCTFFRFFLYKLKLNFIFVVRILKKIDVRLLSPRSQEAQVSDCIPLVMVC